MSWDMGFINPPTLKQLEDDELISVIETDGEATISVSYNDNEGKNKTSAFFANFRELDNGEKVLAYGTVSYAMNVDPLFNALYERFGTIVVDDDWTYDMACENWFPGEAVLDGMKPEERTLLFNVALAFYLADLYHSNEDRELYSDFYKKIAYQTYDYYKIVKKYKLSFTNVFGPSFSEEQAYKEALDATYFMRKTKAFCNKIKKQYKKLIWKIKQH